MNLRKLVVLFTAISLCCVLVLTVMAVGLKESGVKPEETAVSASVVFKNYVCLLPDGTTNDKIVINSSDKKIAVDEFRELEEQVKNATLKTYTESIVWDATFTYKQKDGTEETYIYTKTEENKAINEFLKKYYEDFDKDVNME